MNVLRRVEDQPFPGWLTTGQPLFENGTTSVAYAHFRDGALNHPEKNLYNPEGNCQEKIFVGIEKIRLRLQLMATQKRRRMNKRSSYQIKEQNKMEKHTKHSNQR
jgi:hypothetical protein